MVNSISEKTVFECVEEFKEYGYFLAPEGILITDVVPGATLMGNIRNVIGYEPENVQLENVYLFEDDILLSAEGGNGWTFYGQTEPAFADEILSFLSVLVK
jgi:hypothetical protein